MTEEQEKHLAGIKYWFTREVDSKYRRGQREHGGNVWLKPCMPLLAEEVIDFVVYAKTLKDQLDQVAELIDRAYYQRSWPEVRKAYEILIGPIQQSVGDEAI